MSLCFIAYFTLINVLAFYRMLLWIELDRFMLLPIVSFGKMYVYSFESLEQMQQTGAIHSRPSSENLIPKCMNNNIRENSVLSVCWE